MFLSSLISPAIVLVLYMVFLSNVYKGSFERNLPELVKLSEEVVNGFVAGQLVSSLIAVTCVTVGFSTNFMMVQDKANRTISDINVTPVKSNIVALSYYFASIVATLIVCFVTLGLGLIYLAVAGWYLTAVDVLLLFVDVIILSLFGTALSSVIHFFLSTQGQISVVGTVVGVCYGFLCGAYMPMSEFGEGLRDVMTFFPGTYGTCLVRNHAMNGAIEAISDELTTQFNNEALTAEVVKEFQDAFDLNIYFLDNKVSTPVMYGVIIGVIVLLVGLYVLFNFLKAKNPNFGVIKKKSKKSKEKTENVELTDSLKDAESVVEVVAEDNADVEITEKTEVDGVENTTDQSQE